MGRIQGGDSAPLGAAGENDEKMQVIFANVNFNKKRLSCNKLTPPAPNGADFQVRFSTHVRLLTEPN